MSPVSQERTVRLGMWLGMEAEGGKEVGAGEGWADAAVMSETGPRRWPAQC